MGCHAGPRGRSSQALNPLVACRVRGLAVMTGAYMPSLPLDFVAYTLGLDDASEVG